MIFHFGFSASFNTLKLVKENETLNPRSFLFLIQCFEKEGITSLIDFSPPKCKVFHLTWRAPLGWKPLCWPENCCWAFAAGCRYEKCMRNGIGVPEAGNCWVGNEAEGLLCPLLLCFCVRAPSKSLEKVGVDVPASRGTKGWVVISTTNLAGSLLRIKEWSPWSREDQSAGI